MKGYWKDRRVLVTGYEGFLGSNLTRRLLAYGSKVFGMDIRVLRKETIFSGDDYKKINIVKGDVKNYRLVRETIGKNKIEVIFHLAAEAIVGKALLDPVRSFYTNITGTWNILEASRVLEGVESIVLASSDKAYGTHKVLPYTERSALRADNPYDVSKSCGDLIATAYNHTYGVPVAVTRCGNIFGPGDFNFSRIVPEALRCAILGRQLSIRSDGRFIRDYIFVDDVVDGYIALAGTMRRLDIGGEAFNLSSGVPVTVIDLVNEIYRLAGAKADYKILNRAKHEIRRQYLDSKKAKKVLGWKPAFGLKEALSRTITWYESFLKKGPAERNG